MILDLFHTETPRTLKVRVTPKAKSNCIKKEYLKDGSVLYRIYVTKAPETGKANQAVVELIAKDLNIAKSRISIIRGELTRDKIIKIT